MEEDENTLALPQPLSKAPREQIASSCGEVGFMLGYWDPVTDAPVHLGDTEAYSNDENDSCVDGIRSSFSPMHTFRIASAGGIEETLSFVVCASAESPSDESARSFATLLLKQMQCAVPSLLAQKQEAGLPSPHAMYARVVLVSEAKRIPLPADEYAVASMRRPRAGQFDSDADTRLLERTGMFVIEGALSPSKVKMLRTLVHTRVRQTERRLRSLGTTTAKQPSVAVVLTNP